MDVPDVVVAGDDQRPGAHDPGPPQRVLVAVARADDLDAHRVNQALVLVGPAGVDHDDRLPKPVQLLGSSEAELVQAADDEVSFELGARRGVGGATRSRGHPGWIMA